MEKKLKLNYNIHLHVSCRANEKSQMFGALKVF